MGLPVNLTGDVFSVPFWHYLRFRGCVRGALNELIKFRQMVRGAVFELIKIETFSPLRYPIFQRILEAVPRLESLHDLV